MDNVNFSLVISLTVLGFLIGVLAISLVHWYQWNKRENEYLEKQILVARARTCTWFKRMHKKHQEEELQKLFNEYSMNYARGMNGKILFAMHETFKDCLKQSKEITPIVE